jgi:hypothetical protein
MQNNLRKAMEPTGFEPATPTMPLRDSKTCGQCGIAIEDWAHDCYWCARQEIADSRGEAQSNAYD